MLKSIDALDTPSALIERSVLSRNIEKMQALADRHGVALRVHVKTHKIPEIAKLQLKQGAVGVAVAKLGEAEVMAEAGIKDIQIANIIVGQHKIGRLRQLARHASVTVAVDSYENARELSRSFERRRQPLDVLVKINSGLNRCGFDSFTCVSRFIGRVVELPGIRVAGLMTHAGHVYAARNRQEIRRIGRQEGEVLVDYADRLRRKGSVIKTVSVGSTPTAPYCAAVTGVTELRVGVYVFNDMGQVHLGSASIRRCALTVLATVISSPTPDRVIVDAGAKALALDRGAHGRAVLTGYGRIVGGGGIITRLSEEHGVIEQVTKRFRIGQRIRIIPNHACAVINLFDSAYLVDGDRVVRQYSVAARGRMT